MSKSGIWMHKGGAALVACNALLRHLLLVLFLSVAAISTIADPLSQVAISIDVEDVGERIASLGDVDGDDDAPPLALTRAVAQPSILRAQRLADVEDAPRLRDLDFRFSARGPPV